MAILNSNKKNIRKSLKRGKRRQRVLERVKKLARAAGGLAPATQKMIDKAAQRGIIHKNKAARLKSKLLARSIKTSKAR